MATLMLMLLLVMVGLIVTPLIGSANTSHRFHPTDLMAGDEGED